MSKSERRFSRQIEGSEPSRLVALSDGLFATVLTILVLDLKLPELAQSASSRELTQALGELWPHLFSYVLTFTVTGMFWLAHHRFFDYVIRYNRRLLWLNLSFLLFVGLVPFTSATLSRHAPTGFVWAMYAGNIIGGGVTLALTCGYALSHGLVDPGLPPELIRYLAVRPLVMPAVFLASIPMSFATPHAYPAMFMLMLAPIGEAVLERSLPRGEPVQLTVRQAWAERLWGLSAMLPLLILLGLGLWAAVYLP
jgi:uncharacterized membrane protein